MSKSVKRLYSEFQPSNYNLDLIPDRDNLTFSGTVVITGQKVGRPNKRITLHQNGLTITDAKIIFKDKAGQKDIKITRINTQKSFDELRLHTEDLLYPGTYQLTVSFKGSITPQMNGIYPCDFTYKGKKHQLIATQFESHHAREVFPSIDEPEAKATFDLTLATPDETVIANTPIKNQKKTKTGVVTSFETTPKMSTYLLAFVYGELGYKEAKTKKGVIVRTYATPDNVKLTDFALDTAVKCLDFYTDYFGIDYPLPKSDLIALSDFSAGAMENWGAITFREQAMLVDPKNTSLGTKQHVALVVAHELAHMWFGNLVTMRWWTDLWLNEGFASWVEYLAVDHLFPEWQMWTQFTVDEQQQALKLDALEYTHPIEVPIKHPDEIRSIFDTISYSKGASVIHMLNDYLGADTFKAGLGHYLKKYAYGNTDTVDLWAALEETSKKPVKEFMHSWTSQSGFPVVKADFNVSKTSKVKVSQERFYINPKAKKESQSWPIPLKGRRDLLETVLAKPQEEYSLAGEADSNYLNVGRSGFYRTTYDTAHLKKLGSLIKQDKLGPTDRLGILGDLSETAKSGQTSTVDALNFLANFENESNYVVWDTMASLIGSIKLVMDDEDLRGTMKPYVRKLVAKQLKRLGWDKTKSESHFDQLLRPIILGLAASADEPSVVKKCWDLFKNGPIDPDLRGVVYGTVARHGGQKEFDRMMQIHNSTTLSEERVTLSAALTGFEQPNIIKQALNQTTSKDVRVQDSIYWIVYSLMNRHAKKQAWQWVKDNWDWLKKNLGNDLAFYRMPVYTARPFSDEQVLADYKKFFSANMEPALDRSFNQGVEIIECQTEWKKRDLKAIKQFFDNYSNTGKN